jgi:hypothetical protein
MMVTSSRQHILCTTRQGTKPLKLNLLSQMLPYSFLYKYICNLFANLLLYMILEVFFVEMEPSRGCLAEFFRKILELFCERWRSTIENT